MKEYKVKYWHVLLFVFIVVYLGACLFFRSTEDSRLSFYGDVLNAFGTIVGVLIAYHIMTIEISSHKKEIVEKEEKEIVSQIQDEFIEIQKSQLSFDLEFIKEFNDDTDSQQYKLLRERLLKDNGEVYAEIASHFISISGLSNRLPQKINLIDVCDELVNEWKSFYTKMIIVITNDIMPGFPQFKSDDIGNSAKKLLAINNNMSEQLQSFFIQKRDDD